MHAHRDSSCSEGALKPYDNVFVVIIKGQCKTKQSRALWLLVLVEVQHPYLVLQQVALRVVLEYRAGSGPLSLHVGDLLPIQAYVLLQQILYLTPCAVREVGYGVRLVEDSASVLPVRRKDRRRLYPGLVTGALSGAHRSGRLACPVTTLRTASPSAFICA